jgi:hypothetical protein
VLNDFAPCLELFAKKVKRDLSGFSPVRVRRSFDLPFCVDRLYRVGRKHPANQDALQNSGLYSGVSKMATNRHRLKDDLGILNVEWIPFVPILIKLHWK